MAEFRRLLEELAQNITAEDLEQLKSACKEDIPSGESEAIATSHHWFSFLEKHHKLDKDHPLVHRAHLRDLAPPGPPHDGGSVPHSCAEDLRGGRGGHEAHPHPQCQKVQGHHPAAVGGGDHQAGAPPKKA